MCIQCSFVDPKYRDLAWRVINEIFPIQSYLYTKAYIQKCKVLFMYKRSVETLSHLFFERCPMLNGLWKLVKINIKKTKARVSARNQIHPKSFSAHMYLGVTGDGSENYN